VSELGHSEIQGLFSAYVDQELPAPDREAFLSHLSGCPDCNHHLEQFQQTVTLLRGLPKHRAPPAFSRQVLRRVKQRNRRNEAVGMFFAGPLRVPIETIIPILLAASVVALLLYAAQ
jgi:anti-sigma factor RsiW